MPIWIAVFVSTAALLNASHAATHRLPLREGSEVRVVATAYCLKGRTEAGTRTEEGTIAADPRVLPSGSIVRIVDGPRRGTYTVLDTGEAITGFKIDIFIKDCGRAKRFGKRAMHIRVMRSGT